MNIEQQCQAISKARNDLEERRVNLAVDACVAALKASGFSMSDIRLGKIHDALHTALEFEI